MKPFCIHKLTAVCAMTVLATSGCANFRKLGRDLAILDNQYRVSGTIENADDQAHPVCVVLIEWDRLSNKVFSGDTLTLDSGGTFAFIVKNPSNQYLAAFTDADGDQRHTAGEPLWIHSDESGNPMPVRFRNHARTTRVSGSLSTSSPLPPGELRSAVDAALAGRQVSEFISHQGINFSLGKIAQLDDPGFAATRGADGLWTPATFAIQKGFGIYFLEPYDPSRIPVLFVHGAAGSPQDWRLAMERIDHSRYQPWFYFYPSGMSLDVTANTLDKGVLYLFHRYRFKQLAVVAHSMGGLMSRRFILNHIVRNDGAKIPTFITFSSPWGGHEAAEMGVKRAPEVVPSWRDMANGSAFLDKLYQQKLKGRVNHHLFYSHRASHSYILPKENDGTVSVASQLRAEAREDATEVRGFDETHMTILTAPAPLRSARQILDELP